MNSTISLNRITYEMNKSLNNISSSIPNSFINQNDTTSNLKFGQTHNCYQNLLSRYLTLKSDLEKILKAKRNNEMLLIQQKSEEKLNILSELRKENDILFEKINEQIEKNKKLYYDNNQLYKQIGMKKEENKKLEDQLFQQEKIITQLSYEKDEMEKKNI